MKYLGFLTAGVIAATAAWIFFSSLQARRWSSFAKSALLCVLSLIALLAMSVIGVLMLQTGHFGMARGWAPFAENYLWGMVIMPLGVLFVSLLAFTVLPDAGPRS